MATAQAPEVRPSLAELVGDVIDRHDTVGLAIGVIRDGRLDHFRGDGVADLASGRPITLDTVFRIASITKTFTAIAVMQLTERDLVDLDAPVNEHLRELRLIPAEEAHRPATVRHLLTHAAGLGELAHPTGAFLPDFGESVPAGDELPRLVEFYGGTIRLGVEPGTRFVYNNHGPAILGQLVEDVSGTSLDAYFRENIFEPLGMRDTSLLRTESVRAGLATGYELRSGRVKAIDERDMVTAGAASIYSTPRDMGRYLSMLLGTRSLVLQPRTLASMFEPHYQPDDRLPGMGLGFFRNAIGDHLVVGHQGSHPGFHSQISLAPDAGVAVMAFTNGAAQPDFWLSSEVGGIISELLAVPTDDTGVVDRPETWPSLCGWYRLSARLTDIRLRGMMGLGAEVFVRNRQLMLRFLTPIPDLVKGFPLRRTDPRDPLSYFIDLSEFGMDRMRIVFRAPTGRATELHLDVMPLVLERGPDLLNPRRWVAGAGGTAAAGLVVTGLRRIP